MILSSKKSFKVTRLRTLLRYRADADWNKYAVCIFPNYTFRANTIINICICIQYTPCIFGSNRKFLTVKKCLDIKYLTHNKIITNFVLATQKRIKVFGLILIRFMCTLFIITLTNSPTPKYVFASILYSLLFVNHTKNVRKQIVLSDYICHVYWYTDVVLIRHKAYIN